MHPATNEGADDGWAAWAEPTTSGWNSQPSTPSWPSREPDARRERSAAYRDGAAYDFARGPEPGSGSGYDRAGNGYRLEDTGPNARRIGYEPGVRWPTRESDSTGWPRAGESTQWPPAASPQPGRDTSSGWGNEEPAWPTAGTGRHTLTAGNGRSAPTTGNGRPNGRPAPARTGRTAPVRDGRPPAGVRPPGERTGRRAAPEPTTGGSWRTYLLVGTLLALFAAGAGGALWKSGWLKSPQIPDSTSRLAPTGPAVAPPLRAATPSATDPPATGPANGVTVVAKGAGTFTPSNIEGQVVGTAGTLRRFHVEVENGINENPDEFAKIVDQVLGDPRSWIASGQLRLQQVPKAAPADFTIFLASPVTSEAMCRVGGLFTDKFTSCRLTGQVIINDARWLTAIPDYGASLDVYRAYAINHEVGHELGHGHEACTGPGNLAPVMQQQTLGLKGCVANSWPFVNGQRYAGPPVP
jgi:hypothetical protein